MTFKLLTVYSLHCMPIRDGVILPPHPRFSTFMAASSRSFSFAKMRLFFAVIDIVIGVRTSIVAEYAESNIG